MSETTLNPRTREEAEQLVREMMAGKDLHDAYTFLVRESVQIAGYPQPHWEEKFKLDIQWDNLNTQSCRDLEMQVIKMNEEATFLYNSALITRDGIKYSSESMFRDKFNALVREYKEGGKRLPAEKTLDNLARRDLKNQGSAAQICETEVRFFKNILDHLGRVQSTLKNAGMLLSAELKAFGTEQTLDNAERRQNNGG